jgi:hypothetical protein
MMPRVFHLLERRCAVPLSNRLNIGSIAVALIWTCGMILRSGSLEPASIIILLVCGCLGGWLWYLGMRWFFRRFGYPLDGR